VGTRIGYRLRRPRVLVTALGRALVSWSVLIGLGVFLDHLQYPGDPTELLALVPAGLLVVAVWPIRVLEVTETTLRFRPRDRRYLHGRGRWQNRNASLVTVRWDAMLEVLVASHDGQVTLIAGYRDAFGNLRAGMVELPRADEQAITEAVRRMAPEIPVQQGRLPDILLHTRESYVIEVLGRRVWPLFTVTGSLVCAGVALALHAAGVPGTIPVITAVFGTTVVDALLNMPRFAIALDCLAVSGWRGHRTIRWEDVEHIHLAACGDSVELTVSTRFPVWTTATYRLPRRTDLGLADALIRAYAPPHALSAPRPVE
jgi:hypothetical protein